MKSVRQALVILLSISPLFSYGRLETNEVEKVKKNEQGKVFYAKVYKVSDRDARTIITYAQDFASQQAVSIVDIDTISNRIRMQFKWQVTDVNTSNPLFGTTLTANVRIDARNGLTRINMSDIVYESTSVCGKAGAIEDLLQCKEVTAEQKQELVRSINASEPHDLFEDYERHLERAVRENDQVATQ